MAEVNTPVIRAGGVTLKKTGNSNYWIYGTGFSVGDPVQLYRRDTTEMLWQGNVMAPIRDYKARVQLRWVGGVEVDTDNLINVAVTVTSGGVTSDPYSDTVVINAPGAPLSLEE